MKSFIYGAMTAGFMAVSLFADSAAAAWNDAPATWDLSKKNNFMLYWGQNAHGSYNDTDNKQQQRLIEYCKDTAVDVSCHYQPPRARINMSFSLSQSASCTPTNPTDCGHSLKTSQLSTFQTSAAAPSPTARFSTALRSREPIPTLPLRNLPAEPTHSEDIIACQKLGKKILLSIGGSAGNYAGFSTPVRGLAFGQKLWNMFGKGTTPGFTLADSSTLT